MKILLLSSSIIILATAVAVSGFAAPSFTRRSTTTKTSTSCLFMSSTSSNSKKKMNKKTILDDWTNFFSKKEVEHRRQVHEKEMLDMEKDQLEILERRRDPKKMDAYHHEQVARHDRLDHEHDVDLDREMAQTWTPSKHPLTKRPYQKRGHNFIDDMRTFFSKPERDHRAVQHHLELMDTADAEKDILARRRDPAKMAQYKAKKAAQHSRVEKQHELDAGFEFMEEKVMNDGDQFMEKIMKNVFGIKKQETKK